MKNLLRAAAISVASTALVAGGATVANAAPTAPTSTVAASGTVSATAAPVENSQFSARKRGSKITFKVIARYRDASGGYVSVRRAKLQVAKGGKWKTLKNVRLNSRGKGIYKRTERKKRSYRVIIKPTAAHDGASSRIRI